MNPGPFRLHLKRLASFLLLLGLDCAGSIEVEDEEDGSEDGKEFCKFGLRQREARVKLSA
jgi:hypothetical protein